MSRKNTVGCVMAENRQSLADLAGLTNSPAPAIVQQAGTLPAGDDAVAAPSAPTYEPMPLREKILDKQGRAYATGQAARTRSPAFGSSLARARSRSTAASGRGVLSPGRCCGC